MTNKKNKSLQSFSTEINPNILWATTFVEGMVQAGITAVCIAPGSRSTPLTVACHAHPNLDVTLHLDERSAGFFALGKALATSNPTALICSSGTATANFHPAIIEAYQARVPLLILTADRPPELRESGANQTIDQIKQFGNHVLWAVDCPVPHTEAPNVVLRHVHTLAHRAVAIANGLKRGPVHINFPFRKPLEPTQPEASSLVTQINQIRASLPFAPLQIAHGKPQPTPDMIATLSKLIEQTEKGLIVCGGNIGEWQTAVAALAQHTNYPLLADIGSGLRFGTAKGVPLITSYDTFLMQDVDWAEPDLIIRFGDVPTSKWLNQYLDRINPSYRFHIKADGVWADDSHHTTHFWQADEKTVCHQIIASTTPRPQTDWQQHLLQTEQHTWQHLKKGIKDAWWDGTAVAHIINNLPAHSNLFLGNSLVIRHADQFVQNSPHPLHIYTHRGASGIDGLLSSALGIAQATQRPTTIILGDISFYHDMNGLFAIQQQQIHNISIYVINNGGGGIFKRLPIAQYDPPFTELFFTPNPLDYSHTATLYQLNFARATNYQSWQNATNTLPTPRLIEIMTQADDDQVQRTNLLKTL